MRKLTALIGALILSTIAVYAADKPLVIESGVTKQLPANTTLQLNASSTGAAPVNIGQGTAPSSPNNGDCWITSGGLYCRYGGSTVGPFGTGSGAGTVTTTGSPASPNITCFSGATSITNCSDQNVVYTDANQTFTKSQRGTVQTLSLSVATATPNFDNGNNFTLTLSSACPCTLANPSTTPVAGQSGVIEIVQDGTGSRTITTWGSNYTAAGGTSTLSLSTGANARDYFSYYVADATHIVLSQGASNATH